MKRKEGRKIGKKGGRGKGKKRKNGKRKKGERGKGEERNKRNGRKKRTEERGKKGKEWIGGEEGIVGVIKTDRSRRASHETYRRDMHTNINTRTDS